MYHKISSLILTSKSKNNSTADVYVAQPNSYQETIAGKIFILIEIESCRSDDVKIINFIIENFYQNYYQNEKMLLGVEAKSIKAEHIFESSIAKINKNLLNFLHCEKIKFNPKLLNATIGVVHENNIHFSNIGKNKSLLIYKNKSSSQSKDYETSSGYKIADIIEHAKVKNGNKQINLAKLFSNVISGKIPKNGYFIFTNEALPEYLSNKQLIEIITKLSPENSVEQIKDTLATINAYVSFLALIITNKQDSSQKKSRTSNSIKKLNTLEYSTEQTLSSKGSVNFPEVMEIIKNIPEKISKILDARKQSKKDKIPLSLKDKIFFQKRKHGFSFGKIFLLIKDFILILVNFLSIIFKKFSNKSQEPMIENIPTNHFARPELTQKINCDRKKSKFFNKENILSILILIGIILLLYNSMAINKKNKTIEVVEVNTDLIEKIKQRQNQVEANLLYGNETNAKNILEEIKILLEQDFEKTKKQELEYANLWKKYNEQMDKIKHIVDANTLKLKQLIDFEVIDNQANLVNIIFVKNKIYGADRQQKKIYELNLENNQTEILSLDQGVDAFKHPILDNANNIFYLDDNESVIKLDTKTKKISHLSINLKGAIDDIGGGAGYNNRLYYISKADNQIYRYGSVGNNFPVAHAWLKDNIDLKNAADIEIDGYIYVLRGNGSVLKFLKGKQEIFKLDKIEPKLQFATKLFVSPELNYIYILDVIEKRLIVFNKKGEFILQYQSSKFDKLKDFAINESKEIIYFLNGSEVLEVEGVHFNQ